MVKLSLDKIWPLLRPGMKIFDNYFAIVTILSINKDHLTYEWVNNEILKINLTDIKQHKNIYVKSTLKKLLIKPGRKW